MWLPGLLAALALASACTGSPVKGSTSPTATPSPTKRQVQQTIRLNGRLAFAYQQDDNIDIYILELPSGALSRLTSDPAADFSPAWSPDGKKIAFRSDRKGNDEVFVMNADGTGQRNLTKNPRSDYSPAWSPTGREIAFATTRQDPSNDVWLMDPDGRNPRPLVEQTGIDEYPTWSPDGSRLAFQCTLGTIMSNRVGDFEVCVVNADGTGLRRITDAPGISAAGGWSPDGSLIVFNSNRDQAPANFSSCGDIFVVQPDGAELRKVTDGSFLDCVSQWASDGHIFFSSDRRDPGGETDIWVMNPDGTDATLLTPFPGEKLEGVFFPAGD